MKATTLENLQVKLMLGAVRRSSGPKTPSIKPITAMREINENGTFSLYILNQTSGCHDTQNHSDNDLIKEFERLNRVNDVKVPTYWRAKLMPLKLNLLQN